MSKCISIIEPDAIFRMLLMRMVESIKGFELRHVLSDVDAWPVLLRERSGIVLFEIEGWKADISPYDIISRLVREAGTVTIAFSLIHKDVIMHRAFEAGAIGYLLKTSPYGEIKANLKLALAGGVPLSSMVAWQLVQGFAQTQTAEPPFEKKRSPFVVEVEEAIEAYLADPSETCCSNMSDYLIRRMHLSYGHISTLYRQQTGITLRQYRQLRRIEHVKRLLRTTDQTLTQIAETLEFSSVAHLSASFRRVTGMRPSDFRSQDSASGIHSVKDARGFKRA